MGKFREAPARITTDAPGAVWAHFSKKKKKETGLQYYMHIGVLSTNNLIYHYYVKKTQLARYNFSYKCIPSPLFPLQSCNRSSTFRRLIILRRYDPDASDRDDIKPSPP